MTDQTNTAAERDRQAEMQTSSPVLRAVYCKGWDAMVDGLMRYECPYTPSTSGTRWRTFANLWTMGWDDACDREER